MKIGQRLLVTMMAVVVSSCLGCARANTLEGTSGNSNGIRLAQADLAPTAKGLTVVAPVDNQAELRNPGMGYCLYYYTNFVAGYGAKLAPSDLLGDWPGLTTVYMRIPWSLVEPQEGQFDWSIVDTPMQRFAQAGIKSAFRFTASENFGEAVYATPKWVMEAGAKGHVHGNPELQGNPQTSWEPDFGDPIFLQKLDNFLAAAAARYDGNPDVAYFDVGSFGIWGEGHTWGSTGEVYPTETIIRHMELHHRHFKKTPVAANVGFYERPGTKPVWKPGVMDMKFPAVLPIPWRGKTYTLHVGLHDEEVNGAFKDIPGRLLPLKGDANRTVPIGELRIAADGTPTFDIKPGTLSQNPKDFRKGELFSAAGTGIEYDTENTPNSCKIAIRLFLPEQLKLGQLGPSAFIAVREKGSEKEIVGIKGERMDDELTNYMLAHGITLRDDSVNGVEIQSYFDAELSQKFWRRSPVILENFHYGMMKEWKVWNEGTPLLQAIEDNHASYLSIHWWPDVMLAENRELIRKINLRIGYRFQLQKVSWSEQFAPEGKFTVKWDWRNGGVAPSYAPAYPAITLKDKQGGIVGVFVDENAALHIMMPGKNGNGPILSTGREFTLPPHLNQPGEYDVFVSVGDRTGKPQIALPLDNADGGRRYKIGTCRIAAP